MTPFLRPALLHCTSFFFSFFVVVSFHVRRASPLFFRGKTSEIHATRLSLVALSPSRASVLKWAVPIRVVPPRRATLGAGGRELGFNAMDATGKTVVC